MNNYILVTGAAGFIGFYLCKKLLEKGFRVIGLDNLNDYYDITLKEKRLEILNQKFSKNSYDWKFIKSDLIEQDLLLKIFNDYKPKIVINLAAQAGVRYSLKNPSAYIKSNIVGFSNLLECCRLHDVKNLLYASSSSIYGGNTKIPFSETDPANHPVSLYAATKKSNELMAHVYSNLYNLPAIGMRFFTVYGPLGRPDMAPMIFARAILSGAPIKIFNNGNMSRSFTYIEDIIEIIFKLINNPALPDKNFDRTNPNPSTSWNSHRIFNLGNEKPTNLIDFIETLEFEIGIKANRIYENMQPGDVQHTTSDCSLIKDWVGMVPKTSLKDGIRIFINWYKEFYNFQENK